MKTYYVLMPSFLSYLTMLFNLSLSEGSFPSAWKKSYVLPLPKGHSLTEYSNYRLIPLLCTVSKTLERCVDDQILNCLLVNEMVDKFQTAFRWV